MGNIPFRWEDVGKIFPQSDPMYSAELSVYYNGLWIELGAVSIQNNGVMANAGRSGQVSWGIGLGIDRLAMIQFRVPDVGLLLSTNEIFTSQFKNGVFVPYPACLGC